MRRRFLALSLLIVIVGVGAAEHAKPCEPWPWCRKSPSPSPTLVKAVPKGLSTSGFSSPFYTPRYPVATLNLYWDQVEPTRDVMNPAPLRNALDAAQAAGVFQIRIRPYFGSRAPTWMKALGQGPVSYVHPPSGEHLLVPDLWGNPAYEAEIAEALTWLSDQIDADPRVRLVFATGGMLAFGEPMQRGIAEPANCEAFGAAGYSMAEDQRIQFWQIDAMGVFRFTHIGLAYNPWQHFLPDCTKGSSLAVTAQIMDHHTATFPLRAVLTNHSIRSNYIANPPPLYDLFLARPGFPHQFQTAAASRIGDLRATLDWGIDYLAASVIETYAGAWNELSFSEIQAFNERLEANP